MESRRPQRLTDVLLQSGLVDLAGLQRAVGLVQQTGRRLLYVLVESGLVEETRLVRSLSLALGIESVELSSIEINARVIARMPPTIAQTFGVLPLAAKRANGLEYLYVAMADPLDVRAAEEIAKATGCRLSVLVAAPTQLEAMIARHYGPSKTSSAPPPPVTPELSASISVRRTPPSPKVVPSAPDIIGKPIMPLGIEHYRSDVIQTQLDPEISDIIITPALDDLPPTQSAADERQIVTDHGAQPAKSALEAPAQINVPVALNQAWDDGKTLDVDLEELQAAPSPIPAAASSPAEVSAEDRVSSQVAMAMELPVALSETSSPFDAFAPVNLAPGLERTGIIPVGDFDDDAFQPPPVDSASSDNGEGMVGLSDIPKSIEEVRLRATEGSTAEVKTSSSSPPTVATEPRAQRDAVLDPDDVIPLPPAARDTVEGPQEEFTTSDLDEDEAELSVMATTPPPSDPEAEADNEATDNGEAHDLVRAMRRGYSLNSAERGQVILALGRVLLDKGVITESELVAALVFRPPSK